MNQPQLEVQQERPRFNLFKTETSPEPTNAEEIIKLIHHNKFRFVNEFDCVYLHDSRSYKMNEESILMLSSGYWVTIAISI